MKKRFMSALLCLCLLSGLLAATAFADSVIADNLDATTGDGYAEFPADSAYQQQIDIYAQALDSDATRKNDTYKVELVWGDMAFAWGSKVTETKKWDPTTHTYGVTEEKETAGWWLIDETTPLTLSHDADGSYSNVVTGTKQNNVLMFNHSSKPVNANVSIALADANSGISPSIADASFGAVGAAAADGSIDFALDYDKVGGVVYSKDNATAAAVAVSLANEPADGLLNDTTPTTVAVVTVQLSLPATA